MSSQVCIDAGIAIKLVIPQPDSTKAETVWRKWLSTRTEVIAPPLFRIEVTSVLRRQVHNRLLAPADGLAALQTVLDLQVNVQTFSAIHHRALDLAATLNQSKAYDAHYLALALYRKCDFWTADERLYNNARIHYSGIQWIGNVI